MTGGGTGPRRVMEALEQQDATLAGQSSMMMTAASAERARLTEQIAGLTQETASIDEQILSQLRLVEVAENEFQSITGAAERGFISQRDLRAREEALLARRQQLGTYILDVLTGESHRMTETGRRETKEVERIADAILAALRANDPTAHISPSGMGRTSIDGRFDLLRVAQHLQLGLS